MEKKWITWLSFFLPPFESLASVLAAESLEAPSADRLAIRTTPPPKLLAADGESAMVSVTSAVQDQAITDSDTLSVPTGTETIFLKYSIFSFEYPSFVLSQSIFNDVWTTVVTASTDQQFFQITRQVNSQIFIPPFWQPDSSTGVIVEEIDVSTLTANDIEVTLSASSTNIGDSILPTTVDATLDLVPELRIKQVISDTVPTNGDSSDYSIPRPGQTNTFTRKYTLKLTRPDNSTITNVKTTLTRLDGSEIASLVDEAPGTLVTEVDDKTLEVIVTMTASNPSTIASTPPAVHNILHKFKVEGEVDGMTVDDEKSSNPRRALWKLPDSIARKGFRDPGGDGWSAKGTYEWLLANSASVPLVDDISGEHVRNIGHQTHTRGTDIDTYHFANLISTAPHGGTNYARLVELTEDALRGAADAQASVSGFITTSRTGLATLAALNTVAELIYMRGAATAVLPNGWARSLIETGNLADLMGRNLSVGGSFSNTKVRYQNDHNAHLHIDLADNVLNNNP